MKLYNNQKGNSVIFAILIIAIILIIFVFIGAVYIGIMNSTIYNLKLDMYSINKSAIISVNKNITSRTSKINYDAKDFKKYFEEQIRKNYKLDENLKSNDGLVQEVEIIEYKILDEGKRDSVTNKKCTDTTIHSVIKVKVNPLIMKNFLKDASTFEIHEDVVLNKVKL